MSLASDLRVRTEVTNTVPVVNTLPAVSLSVLDQSINSLPPCNKGDEEMYSKIHQRADNVAATTDKSHGQRGG